MANIFEYAICLARSGFRPTFSGVVFTLSMGSIYVESKLKGLSFKVRWGDIYIYIYCFSDVPEVSMSPQIVLNTKSTWQPEFAFPI